MDFYKILKNLKFEIQLTSQINVYHNDCLDAVYGSTTYYYKSCIHNVHMENTINQMARL